MRILLVDDNPLFCYATAIDLERAGHSVLVARDGAGAFDQFVERMPDALITDIEMRVTDGAQLIRRVLAIAPDLPVVIVTAASARAHDILSEHPNAALAHVAKPLLGRPLLQALEHAVSRAQTRRRADPVG